jgi:preprotein translocase subunit SecA
VVEFDDVMNDQRKVIYEQRAEIMDADHVSDVVEDFRSETILGLVMASCPEGTYPEQWDVEGLKQNIDEVLDLQPPLEGWLEEEEVEQAIIVERLQAMADARMAEKAAGMESDQWVRVEKQILIQTLDHHWKEHLATLDALRTVIHLRSYAQKKPIDEYKQEAFLLFERLLIAIREDVTRTLMRAQIQIEEPAAMPMMAAGDFALPDFITNHIDPLSGDDDTADIDASGNLLSSMPPLQAPRPSLPENVADGETIVTPESRNAPCPCGSGRKYKHCHGQAG